MLRLSATLCTLILLPSMATASALYDELLTAKVKLLGTQRPGPGMGLWAKQTNERLMSTIEGRWVDLGYSDLISEESLNKYCKDFGTIFRVLTTYSFEVTSNNILRHAKQPMHKEYIFKTGMSYNYRWNVQQQMDNLGDSEPTSTQILRNANGTSSLMMLSPNILLEVDFDFGMPFLWGRCPAE